MDKMTAVPRKIVMNDGPSRGRKQCPGCKSFVGVRTAKCDCGFEFEKKEPQVDRGSTIVKSRGRRERPIEVEATPVSVGERCVAVPAGLCPAKLLDIAPSCSPSAKQAIPNYDQVADWADRVLAAGAKDGLRYTATALRYFVRQFYDINSSQYNQVVDMLNEWATVTFARPAAESEQSCCVGGQC